MKIFIRALLFTFAAVAITGAPVQAQVSQRGQPKTAFSVADFAKLHWLEGTWEGTSEGEATFYQQFKFGSDSAIDVTNFSDAALTHETGTARLYLSVSRVYYTFGPGRWGATHVGRESVFFVPQVNARNTFAWATQSPDSWTATQRSGVSGRERVTVFQMRRIK